jgi:hypothetical protein
VSNSTTDLLLVWYSSLYRLSFCHLIHQWLLMVTTVLGMGVAFNMSWFISPMWYTSDYYPYSPFYNKSAWEWELTLTMASTIGVNASLCSFPPPIHALCTAPLSCLVKVAQSDTVSCSGADPWTSAGNLCSKVPEQPNRFVICSWDHHASNYFSSQFGIRFDDKETCYLYVISPFLLYISSLIQSLLGFGTGNPQVGFSHTAPIPAYTVTHCR